MVARAARGFALAELLAAMAIVATLVMVGVPRLFTVYDDMLLSKEASQLAADIRWYRTLRASTATTLTEFRGVAFYPEIYTFSVNETSYRIIRGTKSVSSHPMPSGMTLRPSSKNRLEFNADGSVQTPMSFVLEKGGKRRYVIVDIAGRIRISETPPA